MTLIQRGEAGLMADLTELSIRYTRYQHIALFTVEDSDKLDAPIPGAHTKNLFLKDNGGVFWLVTVRGEARVNLKALPAAIGCKRVSFGKAEDMVRLLGVTPGSVTPLAAINAQPGSINIVMDSGLAKDPQVNVHPLRNTATLTLSGPDILKLLRHWGHAPIEAEIPMLDPLPTSDSE